LIGGEQINFDMENVRLAVIVGILVTGFSVQVQGTAGKSEERQFIET